MKQSSLFSLFGEDESEVADIILDLPNLISESETLHQARFSWGAKRRRSVRRSANHTPSPSHHQVYTTERVTKAKVKAEDATSPSTPLSFSPSESDCKSKHPLNRQHFKKRTREELLEIIDGLTQQRELLTREIETVTRIRDELKAINLELKSKTQEQSSCVKKEATHLEINKSFNLGGQAEVRVEYQEHYPSPTVTPQRPLIMDQGPYGSQISEIFQNQYGPSVALFKPNNGLEWVNPSGPRCIPYLNILAEETLGMIDYSQPLDLNKVLAYNRAKAAEARRSRMIKNRMKGNNKCSFAAIRPPW